MVVPRLRLRRALRLSLGWLGLVAVGVSAFVLTTDMAFPGWIALLPTLGTLGLLLAGVLPTGGQAAFGETAALLGRQPLRYLGDNSYSLYLWHWPIIVFTLDVTGYQMLDRNQTLLVVALSLLLAAASKHFIEDPFRRRRRQPAHSRATDGQPVPRRARPQRRTAYLLGGGLIVLTLVAATVPWQLAQTRLNALAATTTLDDKHPGALALDPTHPLAVPSGVALEPDPSVADQDMFMKTLPNCAIYDYVNNPPAGDACSYGAQAAPKTIVVIGDSHAGMFSTALADFVTRDPSYRVKVMMRNGCPFNAVPPSSGGAPLTVCSDQNQAELAAIIAMKPALVVTAAMSPQSYQDDLNWTWSSRQVMVAGYRAMLQPLSDAGIPVAVIRDVSRPAENVPSCLERNPSQPSACDTAQSVALPSTDPLVQATAGLPRVSVVDLTKWLCVGGVCPAVIGNVVVYRDNHLTDSYVHTLSVPLTDALDLQ